MIKVLIVDDHTVVREGLKQILADAPGMVVAGEAGTGRDALEKIQSEHWDVVLLDLSLPDCSGLEVLKRLHDQTSRPPILVLTMFAEEQYAPRVLAMGAAGFLTKESAPHELVTALRRVAGGGKYIGLSLAERLAFGPQKTDRAARHEILSDREFQVLCLLASGKSPTEIAEELLISVKTVSTHRARVLEKMRLKSNAELIQYAMWHRLVPWSVDAIAS